MSENERVKGGGIARIRQKKTYKFSELKKKRIEKRPNPTEKKTAKVYTQAYRIEERDID